MSEASDSKEKKKLELGPNFDLARARRWKNNMSGKMVRALPWFQPLSDKSRFDLKGLMKEVAPELFAGDSMKDFEVYTGCLMRAGWLINNEHGVWFGLTLNAQDQFEDLGFWEDEESDSKVEVENTPQV